MSLQLLSAALNRTFAHNILQSQEHHPTPLPLESSYLQRPDLPFACSFLQHMNKCYGGKEKSTSKKGRPTLVKLKEWL